MKPKYLQLVDILETMIQQLGQNEMIPSERTLSERYNMSRMTVRKAINHLVQQNKLYRVRNVGTFTTDEKLYKKMDVFKGFTKEVRTAGGIPSSALIEYGLLPADEKVAANLNIKEGDSVYKVIRLRKKNGKPIMVDESYFPKAIIPLSEDIVSGSIYEYIHETLGLQIVTANQRFRATFAKPLYQKYLEIDPNTPVMHVEITALLKDGRVFEYTNSYINTRRYELISKSYQ